MADAAWPLEMAPTPMLPQGMGQQWLYNYLRMQGLQAPEDQFVRPPPHWQVPQSSPPFNDPTQWIGLTRNALATPPLMQQQGGPLPNALRRPA